MKEIKCNKCGYVWMPRIENPKCCPSCKRHQVKYREKEEPADEKDR
jgi:rubrerythrin